MSMQSVTDKIFEEYGVKNMDELNKQWGIINEETALRPIADRILILEDEFKSKFDCSNCGGKGHKGIVCRWCKGTKYDKGLEENGYCRDCTVGELGGAVGRTLGFEPCPECKGKGGSIIVPDDSKKRPTTGKILAIGALVTEFKPGDRVLYTNYTGQDFEVEGIKLRTMRQHDVFLEIKKLNKDKKSSESVFIDEHSKADPDNIGEV